MLMAQQEQEEGWPLGLEPVNARVGMVVRIGNNSPGSLSFSTLLSSSPISSQDSFSDLDTESSGSFFHDKSVSLGSLMGASRVSELSRRSARMKAPEISRDKRGYKTKSCLFSVCSKLGTDAVIMNGTQSLGYFLEAERNAATTFRRSRRPSISGPDGLLSGPPNPEPSMVPAGSLTASHSRSSLDSNSEIKSYGKQNECENGHGVPVLFSCLRGKITG